MAFVFRGSMGGVVDPAFVLRKKTTTAATAVGNLMSETGDGLTRSTSTDTIAGATRFDSVAMSIQVAGDTTVLALKLVPDMLFEVDCTNDTNDNQVGGRRPVTDESTLNNTTTDSNANTAPFEIIAIVGAAATRKALVRYVGGGQVTA